MLDVESQVSERGRASFAAGDDHVRAVRQMVVSALSEVSELSFERTTRIRAEEFLGREFERAIDVMDRGREAYRQSATQLGTDDRTWGTPGGEEARRRAVELGAVRRAMDAGVQSRAPHLASVLTTLRERLPGLEREMMASDAGEHTKRASLESVARLIPPDPNRWDTSDSHRIDASRHYIENVTALEDRNQYAATGLRRVTGASTADPRGAALQTACYEHMDARQLQISERWRQRVQTTYPLEEHALERALTKTGVPPMPAVDPVAMNVRDAREAQEVAVGLRQHGAEDVRLVTPPKPTQAPSVGMSRF